MWASAGIGPAGGRERVVSRDVTTNAVIIPAEADRARVFAAAFAHTSGEALARVFAEACADVFGAWRGVRTSERSQLPATEKLSAAKM